MLTQPENSRVFFDEEGIDHIVDMFNSPWCENEDLVLEGQTEFNESNLCEDCKAALQEEQEEELDA